MAVTWKKLAFESDVVLKADTDVSANGWVIDEDDLSSNLDTKVPTQQSVKAYVDGAGAVNLDYVPQATSGDYTVPTGKSFLCGDVFSIEGANTLSLEGTAQIIVIG